MRRVIVLVVVIFCLLPTFQTSSQNDVELPILYIGGRWTVWRFDPNTMTSEVIYSVRDEPRVSVASLSPNEQVMVEALSLPQVPSTLNARIEGLWKLSDGRLLLQVDHFACNYLINADACAGYAELLILDTDKTTRSIFQLEYHDSLIPDQLSEASGTIIGHIEVNPTHEQAVIVLYGLNCYYCYLINSWGLLIDFSGATVQLAEMPYSYNFNWSPDGQKLAYFDLSGCVGVDIGGKCQAKLKLWEHDVISIITPIPTLPADWEASDSPLVDYYNLTWKDTENLLYDQQLTNEDGTGVNRVLAWHHVDSGSIEYTSTRKVSFRFGDYFVGNTGGSYAEEPIPVILSGDSSLTVLKTLEGYRILTTVDDTYLIMEEDSKYTTTFAETGIFILMPDFQIVKVLLPPEIPEDPDDWVYLIAG